MFSVLHRDFKLLIFFVSNGNIYLEIRRILSSLLATLSKLAIGRRRLEINKAYLMTKSL